MNSDNKFGLCCGCPAIMNNGRELTLWGSSRKFNYDTMNKMGVNNSHDYRNSLQSNGEIIMQNTINDFNTNYKCKNNGTNLFYLDSSNYNEYYNTLNKIPNEANVQSINKNIIKGAAISIESDNNMSLSNISFSPFSTQTKNAELN